jgi:peptide deformylase
MAILKVAQIGNPVLREVAREVTPEELASPGFQQLLDDLLDTMVEYDGVGLAAPQVHVPLRVVVLVLSEERGPEFLVNPKITVLADTTRRTWEGCLSVEGFRGLVERPDTIRVEALDREGNERILEVHGHGAVVIQHECDHLDGTLYVDRILPRSLVNTTEYRRWGPPDEFRGVPAGDDDELDEDLDLDELDDLDDDEEDELDGPESTYDEPTTADRPEA